MGRYSCVPVNISLAAYPNNFTMVSHLLKQLDAQEPRDCAMCTKYATHKCLKCSAAFCGRHRLLPLVG